MFISLFLVRPMNADLVIAPADLKDILHKIEKYQGPVAGISQKSAKIVFTDDQIVFLQSDKSNSAISFSDKSPTIIKHFKFKNASDQYAFAAIFQNPDQAFQRTVGQINGADALIFFNDTEVFVYTQVEKDNGLIELEEWIYARRPNAPQGSQWVWVLKSESWEWPMTMNIGEDGEAKINRNVPISGMTIVKQVKDNYLLQMMLKFKSGDQIKNYFPFAEEIGSIPAANVFNNEGIKRQVNVSVSNSSIINENRPKPKHGLDFGAWDDYWQSIYKISVSANPEEYPLLISPK